MPEFNLIPEARSAPTSCYFCGDFTGPFVATGVDKIEGTVILCAPALDVDGTLKRSGCAGQIAAAVGYVDPLTFEKAREVHRGAIDELRNAIADLEEELDAARSAQEPPIDVEGLRQHLVDGIDARLTSLEDKIVAAVQTLKTKPAVVKQAGKRNP